jgi:hypothetical protein
VLVGNDLQRSTVNSNSFQPKSSFFCLSEVGINYQREPPSLEYQNIIASLRDLQRDYMATTLRTHLCVDQYL